MTERDPLVTVLIAARNASCHLAETLESVRAQTLSDWECIVVDDGSEDETPEIVDRFAASDERFRLIRRPAQGGPYAAANTGLHRARGAYIARLDADDIALPHRLERQVAFLSEEATLRAAASLVEVLHEGEVKPWARVSLPTLPGSIKWMLCVRWFMQSTALIEAEALREIGGYVELGASQDHRVWCELARRGWLGAIPEALVHWRMHERQLSSRLHETQQRLGVAVVREHLFHVSGELWDDEDVFLLRRLGEPGVPLVGGWRLLRRFDRAWRRDPELTPAEREELERFVAGTRRRHIRAALGGRVRSLPGATRTLELVRGDPARSRDA